MERYTYRPLDKTHKEIRVLDVLPGSGKQTVRCQMRHVFLTSDPVPKYETISYCWGDARLRWYIIVDGSPLNVPSSAAKALTRMRRKRSRRTLWIDAVCIKQSDLLEREWQVGLMKEIYSATVCCLVYLGDGKSLARPAAKSLKIVQSLVETSTSIDSAIRQERIKLPEGFNSDAVQTLYFEPWFTRLWILQEVALPCQTICHWGSLVYDFRQLVIIGDFWLNRVKLTQLRNHSEFLDRLLAINRISKMLQADESEPMRFAGVPLSTLHLATDLFRASDSHDYVYSVLGLCYADTLSRWSSLLEPRYTISPRDVFRDATRAAIEEAQSLQILVRGADSLCCSPDTILRASPSWVVSWDHSYNYDEDAVPLHFNFAAADDNHPIMYGRHSHDQDLLLLGGVDACQVVAVSRPVSRNSAQVWSNILEIIDFCLISARPMDGNHINIREEMDIGPALVGGRNVGRKRTSRDAFEEMLAVRQTIQHRATPLTSTLQQSPIDSDEIIGGAEAYLKDLIAMLHRRKVFVTTSGQVGIGPEDMEVNDKVVVLYGSRIPFILRPVGDEYRLVGPCYLQGIMDGEAVRQHVAEEKEDTMFVIR
ncbi:hypothetical protein LTR78_000629 [Recurvomyces mirabilis]|uniref:Ig-like domain-containing protein n=1 Tax=Recurvomyces mirabilis TaxID=574656 RepID=A0AAE0WYD7_9PEZI|nr:hypothetical protein LTR78_000629 [Recurvomyces mirabilis]KAK5162283.1 hypothetical protein LTS14_000630 [Recurvomyces mirabilis]